MSPDQKKTYINQALEAEQDVSTAASQTQALDAAITAAENYMKALKLTSNFREKQKLDAKCNELLTIAERIKEARVWRPVVHPADADHAFLRAPVSTRKLTTREEIILLEGAKLSGFIFLPWVNAPSSQEFQLEPDGCLFTDTGELHLSEAQKEIFAGWKRPREFLCNSKAKEDRSPNPLVWVSAKSDLVQDFLTDCSVVASLCATTSRAERMTDKTLLPKTYPCESGTGRVQWSPSGKYIFCFYFNGCFRKVIIDDRLPSSNTPRSLHMVDRNNSANIWPALVEKAYLKVRGGYDFPGSNSGTDLWVLTGWIPEQVFLHDDDITSDQLWRRLYKAFHFGDLLVTIGTGKFTEKEQEVVGLVSEHDYAVLDFKESNGRRQMLVKNPWFGPDSPLQDSKTRGTLKNSFAGTFWMDCEQVLQKFENLYLNWNPVLFKYREDIHFSWDLTTGRGVVGSFVRNPQFAIRSVIGGIVWLLLGKHFRNKCFRAGAESLSGSHQSEFISIYIFKSGGERVCLSAGALHRGPYVDSPNTLLRFEMAPQTTYTAVVSEQSLPRVVQNFTLSTLSFSPVSVALASEKFPYVIKVQGAWTPTTAGGNAESPRYSTNPQFNMRISGTGAVSVLLETANPDLAIHVKLFWSDGKRITRVRNRDVIADSGDYRRGCALVETKDLNKGLYTLVCSTFSPDQLGKFSIRVSATESFTLNPLALESAGRLSVMSRIGVLPPGKDRMLARLYVVRLTRLRLIARSKLSTMNGRKVAPSPMSMTVELGQGPNRKLVASSEDESHDNMMFGIRVEDFDVQPEFEEHGGVWIVVKRVGGPGVQVEDHLEVEALAEERVEFGPWILDGA